MCRRYREERGEKGKREAKAKEKKTIAQNKKFRSQYEMSD
jgi:hypothetical protein